MENSFGCQLKVSNCIVSAGMGVGGEETLRPGSMVKLPEGELADVVTETLHFQPVVGGDLVGWKKLS